MSHLEIVLDPAPLLNDLPADPLEAYSKMYRGELTCGPWEEDLTVARCPRCGAKGYTLVSGTLEGRVVYRAEECLSCDGTGWVREDW